MRARCCAGFIDRTDRVLGFRRESCRMAAGWMQCPTLTFASHDLGRRPTAFSSGNPRPISSGFSPHQPLTGGSSRVLGKPHLPGA